MGPLVCPSISLSNGPSVGNPCFCHKFQFYSLLFQMYTSIDISYYYEMTIHFATVCSESTVLIEYNWSQDIFHNFPFFE